MARLEVVKRYEKPWWSMTELVDASVNILKQIKNKKLSIYKVLAGIRGYFKKIWFIVN
ncbi:hypothetical protein KCM76_24605 [Zooshikella marina]|uniref:hypothetical protein n=1 Tax=Zooshikella ganghwensis TaxID=202772 RepID=UPI001BB0A00E|nr:hypothetical protein [Zooshikella ganghwensis]MBU2709200.1 hypothetical protein [Zooshikella ganghwensis]